MTYFVESFDPYNGNSSTIGFMSRWVLVSGTNNSSLQAGRLGGQALRVGSTSSFSPHCTLAASLGFTSSVFSLSVAGKFGVSDLTNGGIQFGLGYNNASQIGLGWHAGSSQLFLSRGGSDTGDGTVLWSSAVNAYPAGVYHTFRMKGVIDASAGALALYVDNDLVANLSSINTQQQAANQINTVSLMGRQLPNGGIGAYMDADDIVIKDDNSIWLPECRIQQFLPNGDGATLNLVPSSGTDHFAVVDEATVNSADYLQGTTVGDIDLLALQDLAIIPGSILGVNLVGFAAKTDAASRAWNLGLKSNVTTDNGPDLSLSTSIQRYSRLLETDPDTLAAWTQAGFNAALLQPRVAV